MDDNAPMDSPTSGEMSRPKRRKVETERMREARETEQLEQAAIEEQRSSELAVAAPEEQEDDAEPDVEGGQVVGGQVEGGAVGAVAAATEAQANDQEKAPNDANNANDANNNNNDKVDEDNKDDKDDDAPYQPPPSNKEDRPAGDDGAIAALYEDEYHSDKPMKHVLQGTFLKDLIPMMIGFGDDESPALSTVEFVEDALVSYSVDILRSALDLSKQRGRIRSTGRPTGPPTAEDIVTVVRKDPRKVARVEELLIMQQEIKVAHDTIERQEDLETLAIEHEGS